MIEDSEYFSNLKRWDVLDWFNTLLIRVSMTYNEKERLMLFSEIGSLTDFYPEFRPYARKAGVPRILPDNYPSTLGDTYETITQ